ncbi:MAG: glucose-1-phosphate cytidylyltransferase [Bifidobacteriaceae bacterium]|jgi:glucose-1-phosphate cytidylyltransferase|nr:glucose-1-phosphate cytidylyltransferase [Bifidobacteriaceae bacterium]
MKVVIFAGGQGARIAEESVTRPKPLIEIGDQPILWHIMKNYSAQGFNDFVICCGYKQEMIKQWFFNYSRNNSDVTLDFSSDTTEIHKTDLEPWRVTLVNTGSRTLTGGRLAQVKKYLDDETFMVTYGDAVSNVDFEKLLEHHRKGIEEGNIATITSVSVGQQFGVLELEGDEVATVRSFREKSDTDGGLINAGFMMMEPKVFEYLDSSMMLEPGLLVPLADHRLLSAYYHPGFWQPMDSMRDKLILENYWDSGNVPWKNW